MKHGKHIQVSESFLLCALLTMTGGFLDVYTYITRGHVFANAQTGNVVLLGLNLAEGNIKEVAFYLFPIIAFALGILFTEMRDIEGVMNMDISIMSAVAVGEPLIH